MNNVNTSLQSKLFYLDIMVKGEFRGEVFLNDCPVQFWDNRPPPQCCIPVHPWLVDGVNCLELVAAAGASPSQVRRGMRSVFSPESEVRVRLAAYSPGEMVGEGGQEIAVIKWSASESSSSSAPFLGRTEKDLGPYKGAWAWQNSEAIDLEASRVGLLAYARQLHDLFRRGDGNGLASHCGIYFEEIARAYPAWSLEKIRNRFIRDVEANALDGVACDSFDPERIDFRLCGNGRLVDLVDKGWIPVLRSRGPKSEDLFSMPVLVGRVGGRWMILR